MASTPTGLMARVFGAWVLCAPDPLGRALRDFDRILQGYEPDADARRELRENCLRLVGLQCFQGAYWALAGESVSHETAIRALRDFKVANQARAEFDLGRW